MWDDLVISCARNHMLDSLKCLSINHKLTVTDSVSKPLKVGMQCADFCTNSSSIWAFLVTSVLSLQVQSRGSQAVVKPVLYLFPPVFYKLNVGMLYTSNLFVT